MASMNDRAPMTVRAHPSAVGSKLLLTATEAAELRSRGYHVQGD